MQKEGVGKNGCNSTIGGFFTAFILLHRMKFKDTVSTDQRISVANQNP
jgi:hypothetical protein